MITLGLDWNEWDLQLDGNGNIATIDKDEAIAQTCANAIRLFTKEAYFDQTRGIPHFDNELGNNPIPSQIVVQTRLKNACMNVEGVIDCEVKLNYDEKERKIGGEIGLATVNGAIINLEI